MTKPLAAGALLSRVNSPMDLRALDQADLGTLAQELRQFIIDNVSIYGGHFGASLGVVELTIALHYVFDTPNDALVWDVGHQAYGHKILTGRRELFHTNRLKGGIAGFPSREESLYDAFGVGHSSTSISAALGMAMASKHQGNFTKHHLAVIGDGALTAGMAFEAMNHAGAEEANLLIVLNDNCMSIDPNVGALKEYLTGLTVSSTYNKLRGDFANVLNKLSRFGKSAHELVQKIEHSVKGFVTGSSNLFESLNLRYFGPVDGHDLTHLIRLLQDIKDLPGPKILHCLTVKGKGYAVAEQNQTKWHAPGVFDKITGRLVSSSSTTEQPLKYQEVFGHTLLELARENDKIVGITPAMPSGSSMDLMMAEMPDRTFDVGIAEQHAVTFSAGLAAEGLIPFCNIYSTFLQRAYDQVIHDVCLQNLPVNFFLDRGGLVGADGATHQGAFDLAYLRCIPQTVIAAPRDEVMLRNLMYTAQLPRDKGPFFVRYPRGKGMCVDWKKPFQAIPIGTAEVLATAKGPDALLIISLGVVTNFALQAHARLIQEGFDIALIDLCFLKPLPADILHTYLAQHNKLLTVEDACLMGGMGSAILEFMAMHGYQASVKRLGIPDEFIPQATQQEQYAQCNYDAEAIYTTIKAWDKTTTS